MKRDLYWQAVRGICIAAVVAIHCPTTLNSPSRADLLSWIAVRSAVNFPVPVFFFLAGYFALPSLEKCRSGFRYFVRRSGRLIVPYTFWSVLYVAALAAFRHEPFPIKPFLVKYVTGGTAAPFYYVAVLFQLTLAAPLLANLVNRKSRLVYAVYGLQFAALAAVYRLALTSGAVPRFCYTLCFVWIGFYVFGMQMRAAESERSSPPIRRLISVFGSPLFLAAAFLLNVLESYVLLKNNAPPILAVCQFRLGGVLYSASLIAAVCRLRGAEIRGRFQNALAYLGDISYGVFYVHYMAILAAGAAAARLFPNLPWCAVFVLVFAFALSASVLTVAASRRIFRGARGAKLLRIAGFA